jgi:AraC-like DNA-binding protein
VITTDQAQVKIATELEHFLRDGGVETIYLAEGKLPPPPLSFMVSFPRLSLTLRGMDEMEIDQAGQLMIVRLKRGAVSFVPANGWNRPTWKYAVKVLHFLFGPKHIGVSLVEHAGEESGPDMVLKASYPAESGAIHEILNALTLLPAEPLANQMGPLLVQALLLAVERNLRSPQTINTRKGRNTYEKVCLYLQGHFQEAITRESVAAQFHLNPNHLSRLFRREGPMGFTDYLTWVRIDRAKFLLKHHDLKVDNLARSCGFRDTTYFCRVFRQKTNLTPSRYRTRAQQESRTVR